jgi:hypothetical protein
MNIATKLLPKLHPAQSGFSTDWRLGDKASQTKIDSSAQGVSAFFDH